MLWIQIGRIRMYLGLPDPHPDPLVTSTDPAPDPSIIMKDSKKNLEFYCSLTLWFFYQCSGSASVCGSEDPYVLGSPGSVSGSVRQRYGSEELDLPPDPYQDVTDLQHCSGRDVNCPNRTLYRMHPNQRLPDTGGDAMSIFLMNKLNLSLHLQPLKFHSVGWGLD